MLTNTERQQIVEEVNAGTYGIDEALDDIAAAQKGEEVRKALYAEALVLNREGHAGSTDMIARQQIANLQTSVNGQISTLRSEVGDDIDDLETALNNGLATQNGRIAAQNATIANVVANYNVEYGSTELWATTGETGALASGTTVTLSEDVSHFDYIDIYSFCGNSNVLDTVPVDAKLQSSQGYALRWVNLSDPDSGSYKAYVRIIETRLHIIGTTLTIDHQVTYRNGEEVNISGAEITQSNRSTYMGELGIMKVVGRKITANTEIEDVRIGADGTEYASAGQAVRAQVNDLKSTIPAIDTTLSVSGAAADAEAVGDALAGKADADDLTAVEGDVSDLKEELTNATEESPIDFFARDVFSLFINGANHSVIFTKGDGIVTANGTATGGNASRGFINPSNGFMPLPSWIIPGEVLRIKVATSNRNLRFCIAFFDSDNNRIGEISYLISDRNITVPSNTVAVSMYLHVPESATVSDASISIGIYRSIYDLQSLEEFRTADNDKDYRIGRLSTSDTVDGYVFLDPADWEIGGFNYSFNDYTITYGTNPKRIRTKENFGYPVRAGDVIGMYDYTGFYIYIVIKDATTGVFMGAGARTSDYTVPFDGYAYIYVAKVSDEVYINNVYDYLSKVFIRQASSVISDYKSTTVSDRQFVLSHQYGTPVFAPAETKNIIVCGKNIFRTPHGLTTFIHQNVTKTFDEKTGIIVVSSEGASNSSVAPDVYSNVNGVSWNCLYKFKLPAAMDVVFSANADKDLYLYGDICMHISDGAKTISVYNEPIVFKAEANKEYGIRIYTSASYSGTVTFRPQVEVNKTYPTEFEPFKGVIVDDNGSVTNINTLSDSLDNGVLIDSYTATVISYDDAVTVNYERVRDKDYGYMLYNLNNKKPDYRQPMISFIDDDTTNTTFVENYYNVMHDIGVVGNFAAVTKKISESDALKTMLLGYEADGFGVLLHCYNQAGASTDYFRPKPTDRDINQVRDNMITGLRAINEFGFISKDYWVTPYGVNDPDIKAVAKSLGLKAVISTLNDTPNIHGVTDRYSIGRYSFSATESSINENLPCIKRGMDACIANGGWIIVTTHANEWGDAVEAVSDALSEIVTYANTIGMKVVNFQEGFETYFG